MNPTPSRARAQAGFTLMELMIALAVVAILMAFAAPGFRDTMMNVRMSAQANDLASDLALARSEAVKRQIPVRLCPTSTGTICSGSDWSIGWLVWVDTSNGGNVSGGEQVLRYRTRTSTAITISLSPGAPNLPYRPTGVTNTSAVETVFTLCDGRIVDVAAGRNLNTARQIAISPTGRTVITRIPGC